MHTNAFIRAFYGRRRLHTTIKNMIFNRLNYFLSKRVWFSGMMKGEVCGGPACEPSSPPIGGICRSLEPFSVEGLGGSWVRLSEVRTSLTQSGREEFEYQRSMRQPLHPCRRVLSSSTSPMPLRSPPHVAVAPCSPGKSCPASRSINMSKVRREHLSDCVKDIMSKSVKFTERFLFYIKVSLMLT